MRRAKNDRQLTERGDDGHTLRCDTIPQHLVELFAVALLQGRAGGEERDDGSETA